MIKLTLPVSEDVVRKLKTGDEVYLDGDLVTGRDRVHERVVKDNIFPSVSLKDGAIFHAGPIVAGDGQTGYTTLAVGPTTSMRMEKLEADFIRATGVRIIIGKGGMGQATAEACKKYGAVHLMFAGGAAVLAASEVVETSGAEWTDLGMPEAMWHMRVRNFGPLIVTIDADGDNMFERNKKRFAELKDAALKKYLSE